MLKIQIGNSIIPYLPGISMPLVLKSPLFPNADSRIAGSYILNYGFPASEQIKTEFKNAHRVERDGRATAELPYVISSGILKYTGNCVVTEASSDSYEIAFRIDAGDLAMKLKEKTLKDLDLGGDRTIATVMTIAALANPYIYVENHQYNYPMPIIPLDTILLDITGSADLQGTMFISPITGVIKQRINLTMHCPQGVVTTRIKINNVLLFEFQWLNYGVHSAEYEHDLNLNQGDQVTISMEGTNGTYPELFVYLSAFYVEYSTPNEFDNVANNNLDQDTSDYAIFPLENGKLLDNFPDDAFILDNLSIKTLYSEHFKIVNYYRDGRFPLLMSGIAEDQTVFATNLFTPFVYLGKLLKEIAKLFAVSIVNSPFEAEFKNAVLFNAYSENTYTTQNAQLIPVKPTFNLIDHVPELKLNDFITWISIFTGYMPVINNNEASISFCKLKNAHLVSQSNQAVPFPGIFTGSPKVKVDPEYKGIKFELKKPGTDAYISEVIKDVTAKMVYKGTVADPRDLFDITNPTVNDYYLALSNNSFYVYEYDPETYSITWCFYSLNFPLVYSEGVEPFLTFTTEYAPVLSKTKSDSNPGADPSRVWNIPVSQQPGLLEGFPDNFNAEYGNQVLFYNGMVADSNNDLYPQGTSSPGGSLPTLNARELFESQYAPWLRWLAYEAKPFTAQAILTPYQLQQLKLWKPYSWRNFNFMIKEIRVNVLKDGLSIAEMDGYSC